MKFYDFPVPQTSITALSASILHHYGCPVSNPTLSQADALLGSAPRNVVLLLLDGLGETILTSHLPETAFLRRHHLGTLSSVFPPTTAAAATALETALFPSQSGWLGWSIFWPPLETNVALYPNTTDDGAQAAPVHIGNTFLPTRQITEIIRGTCGIPCFSVHADGDLPANGLSEILECIHTVCSLPGPHMIYGYFNEPDHLLHKTGCSSRQVSDYLAKANRQLEALWEVCPDTLFLLTADHGFTDIERLCLEDYPELEATLIRRPSIEPRAMNLFVKPECHETFLRLWEEIIGDAYCLYSHGQVIKDGIFGPCPAHPLLDRMIGDYLAVAKTKLTLFPTRTYLQSMVAAHGGMTPQELTVPFISFKTPAR